MSGFGVTETVLVLIWALLLIVPIVLAFVVSYFLIKAAVKNGVKEAMRDLIWSALRIESSKALFMWLKAGLEAGRGDVP